MTYLASSAGALIVDRNNWQASATDTSTGAHPPGWTNGQPWSETATEWMNDRNAVYTSRYNDGYNAGYSAGNTAGYNSGYSAGAASKTTSSVSMTSGFTNHVGMITRNNWLPCGTLTCPRTGHAQVTGMQRVGSSVGFHAKTRLVRNGATELARSTFDSGHNQGDSNAHVVVIWTGTLNAGDTVRLDVEADGGSNNNGGGEFYLTVGSV